MTSSISLPISPTQFASVNDYISLLKPRVMSLVVFTGLCGLLMAPGSLHPVLAVTAILCIAVGAGASGALNMWYDRDIDAIMSRTQGRALPQGKIHPDSALAFGVILSIASIIMMAVATNYLAALLLTITIGFYVFVYTMWLKRLTPQNIVIGGAAGALPPVIGWTAVTGTASIEAWILFAIIFLWTPPHFWALSLYEHEEYRRAKIPMLPVVEGILTTKRQICFYSVLLVMTTLIPYSMGFSGFVYLYSCSCLGIGLIYLSLKVLLTQDQKYAKHLFFYSILYLFLLFLMMVVDKIGSNV
jgi:protoheme IX farnesyltransferase